MPRRLQHGFDTAGRDPAGLPGRAPQRLERLVKACLGAEAEDSRLGDLSERYVRTHERLASRLGIDAPATTVAYLVADVGYVLGAANVVLFARAVEPALRLAERSASALAAVDLRERTMAMVRVAAGKLVLPALLLVGSALLISSAIDVWMTWRQSQQLMASLQREKAEAAATQIEQFHALVRSQIGWTTAAQWAAGPIDQRRFDYIRLLRQVPAITEIAQLKADGKEALRVSRLAMDKVDSGADYSADIRFKEASAHGAYVGPVYIGKQSEPYQSVAISSTGRNSGVTVAEVNLAAVWDTVRKIRLGETGYAYIVDAKGRLIAHGDKALVMRLPDLSALPQVQAALSAAPAGEIPEGKTFDTSISGTSVFSVYAVVPTVGWRVFVELPASEARAPLWAALIRTGGMLGLALVAALLAIWIGRRRVEAGQLAQG